MKLSTGRVKFPLEFDNGDKDSIWFNPTDPMLLVRLKDCQKIITEKLKAYDDLEVTADGQTKNDDDIERFREMCDMIYSEIDKAFDSKVSDVVFKHCSPVATINYTTGETFMIHFLNEIAPDIQKINKKADKASQKYMEKLLEHM